MSTHHTPAGLAGSTFLADCVAVMTSGHKRIRTMELLSRLAGRDHRAYGRWDARQLTVELAGHGIRTVKVNGRICVRAADIRGRLDDHAAAERSSDIHDSGDPWADGQWTDPAYSRWLDETLAAGRDSAERAQQAWTGWADAVTWLRRNRPGLPRIVDPGEPWDETAPDLAPDVTLAALDTDLARAAATADAIVGVYRRAAGEYARPSGTSIWPSGTARGGAA